MSLNLRRLGTNEISYLQTIWKSFVIGVEVTDVETGEPLVELFKRTDTVVSVIPSHEVYDCTTEEERAIERMTQSRQDNYSVNWLVWLLVFIAFLLAEILYTRLLDPEDDDVNPEMAPTRQVIIFIPLIRT